MTNLMFYPAFIAACVSVFGLSRIARHEYRSHAEPGTLSELVAAEQSLLVHFRNILLFCGALFAVTMFGFIVPRLGHVGLGILFSMLIIFGELLVAVIPAHSNTIRLHETLAQIMGVGMIGLAGLFVFELDGTYRVAELIAVLIMCAVPLIALFLDKKHFIFYELLFIYASHFSILLAAIALRVAE